MTPRRTISVALTLALLLGSWPGSALAGVIRAPVNASHPLAPVKGLEFQRMVSDQLAQFVRLSPAEGLLRLKTILALPASPLVVYEQAAAQAVLSLLAAPALGRAPEAKRRLSELLGAANVAALEALGVELERLSVKDARLRSTLAGLSRALGGADAAAVAAKLDELFDGLPLSQEALVAAGGESLVSEKKPLSPSSSHAGGEKKTPPPPSPDSVFRRLAGGHRVDGEEPAQVSLDGSTLNDLGLFEGHSGLYALLDKNRTAFGKARLAYLLRHPFTDAAEIRKRQEAARELMEDAALRGEVAEAFLEFRKATSAFEGTEDGIPRHFLKGKAPDWKSFILPNLAGLWLASLAWDWRTALQTAGVMAMLVVPALIRPLVSLRRAYLGYKAAFRLAARLSGALARSRSSALRELGGALRAVEDDAHPRSVAKTARAFRGLLGEGAGFLLDFLYFHSAKTLWRLSSLYRASRHRMAYLFGALAELDVHLSVAETALAAEGWSTFPTIREGEHAFLRIEDGHHPLVLSRGGSVGNDIVLDADPEARERTGNFLILTGANLGGKSTYMRMVAVLAVLAQIGAPVPARAMELTPMAVATSIDIRDSLSSGKSLFDAETDRILHLIRQADRPGKLLVVMDEILQGTDPEDRQAIEQAVVRHLAGTGKLFLVATHNRSIIPLAGTIPGIKNAHVAAEVSEGRMTFTHKVVPGPAASRNAIETLEMKDFPRDITSQARSLLADLLKRR